MPKASSVMTTLVAQKTEATRRRTVKADCEVDFVFMSGVWVCGVVELVRLPRFLGKNSLGIKSFFVQKFLFRTNDCQKSSAATARHIHGSPDRFGASVFREFVLR